MEKPHKKLEAWKLAMDLAVQVYQATESFPVSERYAVTAQTHRAAISVPSNIAEGAARQTRKEFINFLHIAQGSLSELDTLLEFSARLGFLEHQNMVSLDALMQRVDMMISGLIRHQQRKASDN